MTSKGRLNLTSKGRPWVFDSGHTQDVFRRPLEDLQNTSLERCGVICWMSLNFFFFFFWNLFDWPNLSKSNSILKVYLAPSQTSKMELFCQFSEWLLSFNYFRERNSSQKFDWVLNTSLILSSNVTWYVYKSLVETEIFRLDLPLICPLYVKKEEWNGKKLQKNKIYYFKCREL